ncbi:MAG: acetate kinase, partial [Dolichospermum sp.]
MKILVLNAGSSSQKSCLYDMTTTIPPLVPQPLWEGKINWTQDNNQAEITVKTAIGTTLQETIVSDSPQVQFAYLLSTLIHGVTQVIDDLSVIDVVGHRIVHG